MKNQLIKKILKQRKIQTLILLTPEGKGLDPFFKCDYVIKILIDYQNHLFYLSFIQYMDKPI